MEMMDREKVIEALQYMISEDCTETQFDYTDDIEAAIALLKEQEAVKPKSISRHGEYPQIVHRCGNCNEILYRYYKHCPTCGRTVKWE